jgi:hypothetical protein
MAQVPLTDFSPQGADHPALDLARRNGAALWFPHPDHDVLVTFDPTESDDNADASWVEQPVGEQHSERLTTREVVERLTDDDPVNDVAVVEPATCGACFRLVPPTCTIDSASLTEHFCSASCLHEMETHFEEPLTPTEEYTKFTHPMLRVEWTENNVSKADVAGPC